MALSTPGRARRSENIQATAPAGLTGLGNRFVELFGRKLSRRSFAVETARLIAESVRIRAVAILGYDRRRDRLVLLAEHGLRPEARTVLGAGVDCTWDIPMRGLRNRRISVVEAAHQNPFVPPSLVQISPSGLCIASVPLYYDYEPVGVVLLFSAGSRAFPDTHLQTLSQALRVCARGLRDTSGPAVRPPPVEPRDESADAAAREAAGAEPAKTAAPAAATEQAAEIVARVQRLEEELQRAREEAEHSTQAARSLTASANAAKRERDSMAQQLADAERAREVEAAELRAHLAALEERLLAVDSERARSQRVAEARTAAATQSVQKLEAERDALAERATAAEAGTTELQTQLTAERAERERLATSVERLTAQLRTAAETLERTQTRYAQERATTEADRDAWREQAGALRAQLTERSETLSGFERELRAAAIARDSATSQLHAARAEIDRLTLMTEELSLRATQLEAARAAALAEGSTVQRMLDEERGARQHGEETGRTELMAARQDTERIAAEAASLADELTERRRMLQERDTQLASLRVEYDTLREAEVELRQGNTTLRADVTTLTAQLEHAAAANQLLAGERASLRDALADARQRASHADVAHAAVLGQVQAEAVELRRQIEAMGVERETTADRLQRALEEGRDLTLRLAETQRRTGDLHAQLRQREMAVQRLASERETLAAQAAVSAGQLQAAQEALERVRAVAAQERKALEGQRDEWQAQATATRDQLAQSAERLAVVELELRSTSVARDTTAAELQTAAAEVDRLALLADELRHAQTRLEAERIAGVTENAALRAALDEERTSHAETERGLRAELGAARTEAEHLSSALRGRQEELTEGAQLLAERDAQLSASQREIEALRQQSTDRGVLARQARDLGSKVVELEQSLAAAHGEAARAERQRAALEERLDNARRREAATVAAANQERFSLQETVQRITDERERAEADKAALRGEIDGLRGALAEVQATLESTRAERALALDAASAATQQLSATEERLQRLDALLNEREAALAAAAVEIQRSAAQVATTTEQLQIRQEAFDAARLALADERDALAADRDSWQQQAARAHAEGERLASLSDELQQRNVQVEGERNALATELAALRDAAEEARSENRRATEALAADLVSARADADRLAAEAARLHGELAERDAQLDVLRQREDTTQQMEAAWQQERDAMRRDMAMLAARIDEREAECEQLRAGRAALEHQLTLVTATQGEAEQALAQGLDAARAQINQLEEERAALAAALADTRERLAQTESAHQGSVAVLDAETARLRRQLQSLGGVRTKQAKRLEETERALTEHAERLEEERRQARQLTARSAQLEQSLAAAVTRQASLEAEAARTRAEVAAVTAQLAESTATAQRLRDERQTLARELAVATAGHDEQQQARALELQAARQRIVDTERANDRLEATLADTQRRMADADSAHVQAFDQMRAETAALHQQVHQLVAARDELAERLEHAQHVQRQQTELAQTATARAGALAQQTTRLEQALRDAEERRAVLDAGLAQAQTEIEALRQQSDDRGVLAHQASELGRTVVELEQELAALRGEVARAERERAAVTEELAEAKRVQADAEAAATQRATALQAMLDRLVDEQHRLEAESAARLAEADAARTMLADERLASETLRADYLRTQEEGQDAVHRLSEMHRRLEELGAAQARRDVALEASTNERQRLTVQITKITAQLRAAQETLVAVEGRSALERAAAEADRDTWKAQAASAVAEVDRLTARAAELVEATTQLEALRNAAATENATLRAALDEARAGHRNAESALHAELAAAQSELEHLSADAVAQRAALADRDEQLMVLHREQEAARARDAESQQFVGALRAEVAALTVQLRESGTERHRLGEARDVLEREIAAAAAARARESQAACAAREQIALLEAERTTLRAAIDDMAQQAANVEALHGVGLAEFRAEVAALRSQLAAATAERSSLTEGLQRAEQALAAQTAHAEQGRQHAIALADRCEHLEQALASAEARQAGLDGEVTKARREIEALRVQSADRGALAHQANELESRVRQLAEQLAAQQADGARIERQRAVLEEQLRTAREYQEAAAAAAEQEQATLRDMLTRAQEERRQLDAEHTQQATAADALRAQVAELRAVRDQLAAERDKVREEGQDAAQRLSETQQRMEELSGLLQQRDGFIQTVKAERESLTEAARRAERSTVELASERDELRRALAELGTRLEQERLSHSEEKAALARDLAVRLERQARAAKTDESEAAPNAPRERGAETTPLYQEPLAIERSAPLGAIVEGIPEPLDAPPTTAVRPHKAIVPSGELVLLDDGVPRDAARAALKGAGFEVTTFPPTEAGVDEMLRRKVKCIMLNVGGGVAAWHTLRVLRERVGSRGLPILAYVMTADAPAGFCFGRADFALWPTDPARMIERLERLRPKLKRLLLLSADVDGMGRLREPLAEAKISTSIVLDGKQALEFATMVEPEAAILHLSPSCPSVSRAVAGLRATEATRDLPLLLLLDKTAAPREDTFFTATTAQLVSKPAFRFTNLPEEIARVIG